jgi:DNA repair exonuclease SbcCD ATPase subunit
MLYVRSCSRSILGPSIIRASNLFLIPPLALSSHLFDTIHQQLSSLAAAVKSAVGDAESVPVGEDGKDAHDGDDSLFEAAVKRMEAAAEEARDKAEAIERKSEVDEGKFRNLQSVIDRELSELRSEVDAARDGLASAVKSLERAREVDAQVAEARSRLKAAETAENPHVDAASQSKAALGASIARLEMLKGKREEAMKMLERWGEVDDLFGKRGLQSFVYEVAVLELQARAARYLEGLSDDSLRLELKLEGQVVERRLLTRLSDGTYASRSLQQLSGGQWRRLGLALTLAFSECSLERTATTCNLIVLDEVMQHLDSEGCARVGKLLEAIVRGGDAVFSTALIILQTSVGEELGDSFDQVDVVVKRQDCSLVLDHDGKEY